MTYWTVISADEFNTFPHELRDYNSIDYTLWANGSHNFQQIHVWKYRGIAAGHSAITEATHFYRAPILRVERHYQSVLFSQSTGILTLNLIDFEGRFTGWSVDIASLPNRAAEKRTMTISNFYNATRTYDAQGNLTRFNAGNITIDFFTRD